MKPARGIFKQSPERRRINARRALKRYLAQKGGRVFGSIPAGVRREFFCLDERTWVWHEEWDDERRQHHAITTRYDVRPDGILKSQGVNSYQRLSVQEERNFRAAVRIYSQMVRDEVAKLNQQIA